MPTLPSSRKKSSDVPALRYMLDTNVVSDLVRRPGGAVARRAAALEPGSMAVSIVVASELRYDAERRGSIRLSRQIEAVLSAIETLPLAEPADRHYGMIRAELERAGRSIGRNDLLIAAHARALGATLVTGNVGEFNRISGLTVEDWR